MSLEIAVAIPNGAYWYFQQRRLCTPGPLASASDECLLCDLQLPSPLLFFRRLSCPLNDGGRSLQDLRPLASQLALKDSSGCTAQQQGSPLQLVASLSPQQNAHTDVFSTGCCSHQDHEVVSKHLIRPSNVCGFMCLSADMKRHRFGPCNGLTSPGRCTKIIHFLLSLVGSSHSL